MTISQAPAIAPDAIIPEGYHIDAQGVYFDRGEAGRQQIASTPAWVAALTRDTNAEDWSIVIKFVNRDRDPRSVVVSYGSVLNGGSTLMRDLAARGLLVLPLGEALFRTFLATSAADQEMPRHRAIRKLGFTSLPASGGPGLAFMLPSQTLLAQAMDGPAETLVFQPSIDSPAFAAYRASGTLEAWQAMIAPLTGHPLFVFALCAGLAGPFVELAGVDNTILHFHGPSSVGKTTLLQLAASLWGVALDPQHSGTRTTLIERWHATGNAMELLTAIHSGIGLVIDELGGNTDPLLSIYNITSGRGKQRMAEGGGLRAQLRWSLFVISSGELALVEKIETASGRRAKTGEVIRAMDIPVADLADPKGLSDAETGRRVQAIKQQCGELYGTAGPAFIRGLLDHFADEEDLIQELRTHVKQHHASLCATVKGVGYRVERPHRRALRRLALVRTLGVWGAEILGLTEDDVTRAVDAVALAWIGALPPLSEGERIAGRLRDYLDRHHDDVIDYDHHPEDAPVPADLRVIRHQQWVLFTEEAFAEACGETPSKVAAEVLRDHGMLHREVGKLRSRHVLGKLGLPRAAYFAVFAKHLLPDSALVGADGPAPEAVPGEGDPEPEGL